MSRTFSSSRYFLTNHRQIERQLDANASSQRNLNNAFAYDLVPSPSVIAAALKAARRVNDFATAVRIFEGTFFLSALRTLPSPDDPSRHPAYSQLTTPNRHQGQGRLQGPVRAIPQRAQAPPRGAWRSPEGGPLPRAEINFDFCERQHIKQKAESGNRQQKQHISKHEGLHVMARDYYPGG